MVNPIFVCINKLWPARFCQIQGRHCSLIHGIPDKLIEAITSKGEIAKIHHRAQPFARRKGLPFPAKNGILIV